MIILVIYIISYKLMGPKGQNRTNDTQISGPARAMVLKFIQTISNNTDIHRTKTKYKIN